MSDPTPPILSSTTQYYRPVPVFAARQPRPRYWFHALLLAATCFTTLIMGGRMQYNFVHGQPALSFSDEIPYFPASWMFSHPARLLGGIPFAATVMLFFLAHEMGHYLCCRRYGIYSTLPFFIPMPISPIGTMGAVILIRSPIRSRTALFDVAIAGPIAGFVVAALVLTFSFRLSRPLPLNATASGYELAYPLVFTLTQRWLSSIGVLHGTPALPLNGLLLHPTAIAAWVGMFATTLNLLPGGQLDGGHIVFSLAPRIHKFVSRLTILILLPMAYYLWTGWMVWAILLQLSSFRHPQVAEWPRVSGLRTGLAIFAVLMLGLTMMPAPFAHSSFKEILPSLMEGLPGFRQR